MSDDEKVSAVDQLRDRLKDAKNFHVDWGPEAHKLTPDERAQAILDALDESPGAQPQVGEPLRERWTAIPTDQLVDVYDSLRRLTGLGQATIDEWLAMDPALAKLRHEIFSECDMATVFAGQWLPRELRDRKACAARDEEHRARETLDPAAKSDA